MSRPSRSSRVHAVLYGRAARGVAYQVLLAAALLFAAHFFYSNVRDNLARQGIATGFDFLRDASGFDIGESLISFESTDSYGRALWVGVVNTLRVAAVSIVLATILGVTIGIARLSTNWLSAKLASIYVETIRNVPVVLHAMFWAAVLRYLPAARSPLSPFDGVFISNRGISFPIPADDPIFFWSGVAFVLGIVASGALAMWARRYSRKTGHHLKLFWPAAGLIIGFPLAVWVAGGAPMEWSVPALTGFNYTGGKTISPEYAALLIGISVYASAFIAEIVRAGIASVSRGEIEAAKALGLRKRSIMRYVILPQAARVIVPPLTSQYLGLAKNTSLGVLVGYPDLVSIGNTTLNQSGRAVEAISIMMIVYLAISLTISLFMNSYNRIVVTTGR